MYAEMGRKRDREALFSCWKVAPSGMAKMDENWRASSHIMTENALNE